MRHDETISAELPRARGSSIRFFELAGWRQDHGLVAGIATTDAGVDFALADGQPIGRALDSWRRLPATVGAFPACVVSRQIHGADIATYSAAVPDGLLIRDGFDGHVTGGSGLLLAVTVADCVPVYLTDPTTGRIGLLHAGWRGTAAGVLEAGVRALTGGNDPAGRNIAMHCGIAICGSCYEVGPEVIRAVSGRPAGRPERLDLRAALAARARSLGVQYVTVSPLCTVHDSGFASYRRQGAGAGRMAAFLGRPVA